MNDDKNGKEDNEDLMVDEAFNHLVQSYLNTKHRKKTEIIQKAFNFAKYAHKGVK